MGDVLHLVSMDLVTSPVPKATFFLHYFRYAILTPRKKDTKLEPVRKPDSVEYMKTHTAQESSTITHPTPLAGISK